MVDSLELATSKSPLLAILAVTNLHDLFFCIKTFLLHFVTKSEPNFGPSILKRPQDQKYFYGPAMPSVPPFLPSQHRQPCYSPNQRTPISSGGWLVVGGLMI